MQSPRLPPIQASEPFQRIVTPRHRQSDRQNSVATATLRHVQRRRSDQPPTSPRASSPGRNGSKARSESPAVVQRPMSGRHTTKKLSTASDPAVAETSRRQLSPLNQPSEPRNVDRRRSNEQRSLERRSRTEPVSTGKHSPPAVVQQDMRRPKSAVSDSAAVEAPSTSAKLQRPRSLHSSRSGSFDPDSRGSSPASSPSRTRSKTLPSLEPTTPKAPTTPKTSRVPARHRPMAMAQNIASPRSASKSSAPGGQSDVGTPLAKLRSRTRPFSAPSMQVENSEKFREEMSSAEPSGDASESPDKDSVPRHKLSFERPHRKSTCDLDQEFDAIFDDRSKSLEDIGMESWQLEEISRSREKGFSENLDDTGMKKLHHVKTILGMEGMEENTEKGGAKDPEEFDEAVVQRMMKTEDVGKDNETDKEVDFGTTPSGTKKSLFRNIAESASRVSAKIDMIREKTLTLHETGDLRKDQEARNKLDQIEGYGYAV